MQRIRHPGNKNLSLFYKTDFFGYPVQKDYIPYISEYLNKTKNIIETTTNEYSRVFAFRVDLRFPSGIYLQIIDGNTVIERFVSSLKAKIRHNRDRAKESNPHAHDTIVRYVWCREVGNEGFVHYHVAVLLNNDAFCTLGKFEMDRDNLFNRMHEAWASALRISSSDAIGLVHFPENPFYQLRRNDSQSIADFFYRVSYLSKAATKLFGNNVHGFGASRA